MTILGLADQLHVAHSTAEEIARGMDPRMRPSPKTGNLSHYDAMRFRRALLQGKPAPRPPMTPVAAQPEPELFMAADLPEFAEETEPEGMTLIQIAELCKVGVTTVRRWADLASAKMAQISAKMAQARETSVAAQFSEPEVLAIVEAGGRGHEAELLASASKPATLPAPRKPVLSAALVREYRLAANDKLIDGAAFRYLLGINPTYALPQISGPSEPLVSIEEGSRRFGEILERVGASPMGATR